jgi:hypothetical protein
LDSPRYQLLIVKPHPVTAAIALMYQNHQDMIDDFLNTIKGDCNPTEPQVEKPPQSSPPATYRKSEFCLRGNLKWV